MDIGSLKKQILTLFFLFLPLIVFAQSSRTQAVALVPFWGEDDYFIQEFGEELYNGVNDMQGFRSVIIDMTDLPDDVPDGGFPPYICPSPSLIKTNPIALTGELTSDPDDEEYWHLRLYLWEMAETRLVFSDELTAYDRDECAAALPGMLEWLFSWLTRGRSGSGDEIDLSELYGSGREVFITTSMPLQWIYVGARLGWIPLRMQSLPDWGDADSRHVFNDYRSLSAALSGSIALFPEAVPVFSRFSLKVEGIFNYDLEPVESLSLSPAIMLIFQAYRQGNMLLSLFAGGYTPFKLNDKIEYGTTIPGAKFPLGWMAGLTFGGKLDPIPGVFFLDIRYSMDLFNTFVKADPVPDEGYRRVSLTISIGYEYGFITKK